MCYVAAQSLACSCLHVHRHSVTPHACVSLQLWSCSRHRPMPVTGMLTVLPYTSTWSMGLRCCAHVYANMCRHNSSKSCSAALKTCYTAAEDGELPSLVETDGRSSRGCVVCMCRHLGGYSTWLMGCAAALKAWCTAGGAVPCGHLLGEKQQGLWGVHLLTPECTQQQGL